MSFMADIVSEMAEGTKLVLSSSRSHLRAKLSVLIFVILGVCFATSIVEAEAWSDSIVRDLDALHHLGVLGGAAFVALEALVALLGVLPASLLGVVGGAIFGATLGFILSAIGVLIGAVVAFGLARSALRPTITQLLRRRASFSRLDEALGQDGWRLVLLLRASPIMPFSITSYALGLSAIGGRDYALGTLAALPALFLYAVLGTLGTQSIAAIEHGSSPIHLTLLAIGVILTALTTLRIGYMVKRIL